MLKISLHPGGMVLRYVPSFTDIDLTLCKYWLTLLLHDILVTLYITGEQNNLFIKFLCFEIVCGISDLSFLCVCVNLMVRT